MIKSEKIKVEKVEDKYILYNAENEQALILNGTGYIIFDKIESLKSENDFLNLFNFKDQNQRNIAKDDYIRTIKILIENRFIVEN